MNTSSHLVAQAADERSTLNLEHVRPVTSKYLNPTSAPHASGRRQTTWQGCSRPPCAPSAPLARPMRSLVETTPKSGLERDDARTLTAALDGVIQQHHGRTCAIQPHQGIRVVSQERSVVAFLSRGATAPRATKYCPAPFAGLMTEWISLMPPSA